MSAADVALTVDGHPLGRAQLATLVARAASTAATLGLGPGVGLAVAAGDPLGTIVAAAVAAETGAAVVLTRLPRAALASGARAGWARLWSDAHGSVALAAGALGDGEAALPPTTGAVLWTSGSAGPPRMVALGRDGLAHQARATAERLGVDDGDDLLLPLALDHAYGFSVVELARASGARLHVETSPSARRIVRRLRGARITVLDGFPSLYRQLLGIVAADPGVAPLLAAPRVRGCGGDVLAPALARDFEARVGAPLHDGYGLTEAGPNVALSAPGHHRPGTVGPPLRDTELRLAPDGELLVRSPSVMLGYLDDEPATRAALDADGWLRTGDLARLERDGHVTVTGRKKHVIVVHGECHSPTTIEEAALSADDVAEAIAVGDPGRHPLGDRITLFVSPAGDADGAEGVERRVVSACRAQLPVHLRPHAIVVLDAIPRGMTGKPDRDMLRTRVASPA